MNVMHISGFSPDFYLSPAEGIGVRVGLFFFVLRAKAYRPYSSLLKSITDPDLLM
jgi:hypothetical protein